jgi:hypothetical protein
MPHVEKVINDNGGIEELKSKSIAIKRDGKATIFVRHKQEMFSWAHVVEFGAYFKKQKNEAQAYHPLFECLVMTEFPDGLTMKPELKRIARNNMTWTVLKFIEGSDTLVTADAKADGVKMMVGQSTYRAAMMTALTFDLLLTAAGYVDDQYQRDVLFPQSEDSDIFFAN